MASAAPQGRNRAVRDRAGSSLAVFSRAVSTASLDRAFSELTDRFRRTRDAQEAHLASVPLLQDLAASAGLVEAILSRHLARPDVLRTPHFPVVSFHIARNPYVHLLANAWMAHPDQRTDLTTKAIHLHDRLFLTTVTIFGPGYEHWLFERPRRRGGGYRTRLVSIAPHPPGQPAFVDTEVAHTSTFPSRLSLTLCLWTPERPGLLRRAGARARRAARDGRARIPASLRPPAALLDRPLDFYPGAGLLAGRLAGLPERHAFPFGPCEDYCHSLVHILQETGCEHLAAAFTARTAALPGPAKAAAETALARMQRGESVAGRYSEGQTTDPTANFTRAAILSAIAQKA